MYFLGVLCFNQQDTVEVQVMHDRGHLQFDHRGSRHRYIMYEKVSGRKYFPHVQEDSDLVLELYQDPSFCIRNEKHIYTDPLPFPLNVRVYHNPILMVLSKDGSSPPKYLSMNKRTLRSILTGWNTKDNGFSCSIHREKEADESNREDTLEAEDEGWESDTPAEEDGSSDDAETDSNGPFDPVEEGGGTDFEDASMEEEEGNLSDGGFQ